MMTGRYLTQLNRAYEQQAKLMEQSDGSKLHRASDDAVGYSKYLRYQNSLTENTQYQSNVKTAVSWMKNSDSALVDISDCFSTIVAKANAAPNTYNNTSDMTAIAKEMLAMVQQSVADANTQVGDRYLFAGQSDMKQPYTMSTATVEHGLAKTLDDTQKSFFTDADTASGTMAQMITLTGSDGNTYYANTTTGKVYTETFMTSGYKDKIAAGQTTVTAADGLDMKDAGGTVLTKVDISANFKNTGEITAAGKAASYTVSVAQSDGTTKDVTLSFATVKQQIVTYSGDDKYISMTKKNGAQDQTSDTVNVTGQDVFGTNIFDDSNSGNTASGTAALNDMLTVQAQTGAAQYKWLSTDGITLANNAYNTVNTAETKLAARQQVYTDVQDMLTTQNTAITSDVSTVADTDVAALAVKLMTAETIYNMSLSVGSKILPKSLADYLS